MITSAWAPWFLGGVIAASLSCSAATPPGETIQSGAAVVFVPDLRPDQAPSPPPVPPDVSVVVSSRCPKLSPPSELSPPFMFYTNSTQALAGVVSHVQATYGKEAFDGLDTWLTDPPSNEESSKLLCLMTEKAVVRVFSLGLSVAKEQAALCQHQPISIRFYPPDVNWAERWNFDMLPSGEVLVASTPTVNTPYTLMSSVTWIGEVAELRNSYQDLECPLEFESGCMMTEEGDNVCDIDNSVGCESSGLKGWWGLFWPTTGEFRQMDLEGLHVPPALQQVDGRLMVDCPTRP